MTALLAVLTLNLVALGLLLARVRKLGREVRALRAIGEEVSAPPPVPPELVQMARDGAAMVSIRILNPMELAAQKSWLAGVAGRITPRLARRFVSQEVAKTVRQELPKYGVVAEVKVVESA
ncbi:MAG: hypothetical protein ACT4P0_13925 [Panacagrimonas sp.]